MLRHLQAVSALRAGQAADPAHQAWVFWVKEFQSRRFGLVYEDLLAGGPFEGGARFFITELYGPQDMSQRDAQFERVLPALERVFPEKIQHTVAQLTGLHALSESLDDQVARAAARVRPKAPGADREATRYVAAWQAAGRPADREKQITLVLDLVQALERHTRSRLLRTALRAMRTPARAAGLGALQHFLETGFDTFGEMGDTQIFQSLIAKRERALAAALFSAEARDWNGAPPPLAALAMLPTGLMAPLVALGTNGRLAPAGPQPGADPDPGRFVWPG